MDKIKHVEYVRDITLDITTHSLTRLPVYCNKKKFILQAPCNEENWYCQQNPRVTT